MDPVSYEGSLSSFDSYDESGINDGNNQLAEESMRVLYEDPGQRDEKKRLMSLFESQPQVGEAEKGVAGVKGGGKKSRGKSVRRSQRIAGF